MVRLKGNKVVRFKSQDFSKIKKQCLERTVLFEDPAFPAIDPILGSNVPLPEKIVWKRPQEICGGAGAKLFADVEKCDGAVKGGPLSCYWMVSACSILANVSEIRNRVIPDYWDQECIGEEGKYCGAFLFRFWRFGNWHEVVVDDMLPTVDNSLLTTHTENKGEFWTSLLEKAYAKLHGSYENLREHEVSDALVDFTGGVTETMELGDDRYSGDDHQEARNQLVDTLLREMAHHTIVCMSVQAPTPSDIGSRSDLGLCRGHQYQVTDVKKVYLAETNLRNLFKGREKVAMIRLRDPRILGEIVPGSPHSCGSGEKFAYSTSTLSRLRSRNLDWQKVKDSERHRLGLLFSSTHEFWMPIEDVLGEFTDVTLCRLVNEDVFTLSGRKRWSVSAHLGRWEPTTITAGGGDIDMESFVNNPQYLFRANCDVEVMIQLMQFQNPDGLQSPSDDRSRRSIGFHVIKVEENRETRLKRMWGHCSLVVSEEHKSKREVSYRGRLPPGTYFILPSTLEPGEKARFLIRMFTRSRHSAKLKEVTKDTPKRLGGFLSCVSCFADDAEWVTVIIVNSAESLTPPPSSYHLSRLSVYCKLTCEGETVKTRIAKDEHEPAWDTSYLFYRKSPHKPISVQVYKKNAVFPDELIGESHLVAGINHALTPLTVRLHPKRNPSAANTEGSGTSSDTIVNGTGEIKDGPCGGNTGGQLPSVGSLHLTLLTEDNLMAV